jgi:nicotinate-nucleotide--dimethylbenzimidazole phosphoribosyltransferase
MKRIEITIGQIVGQDQAARAAARARLEQLSMPRWALGRLMDLAEDLAGMTASAHNPPVARKTVVLMAADHGVTAEGVSLYHAEVTPQMVHNFVRGGAGINALARLTGTRVVVVDMGVAGDLSELAKAGKIKSRKVRAGTSNIARGPAMSRDEAIECVQAGIETATELAESTDIFGIGEMGIGNTTAASAIVASLTGLGAAYVTGRGTGVDDELLRHKVAIVEQALTINRPKPNDALDVLAKVGGFEIGGIAGVILGAAALRKPVLVDGFITTAAAMLAQTLAPNARAYMVAAHRSVEPGHRHALEWLKIEPLLDLNMRLGEGTGAALAMNLVDAAVRVLTEVATFAEASVSEAKA